MSDSCEYVSRHVKQASWLVVIPCLTIYTYFSETRVQVRPVDGFLRAIAH